MKLPESQGEQQTSSPRSSHKNTAYLKQDDMSKMYLSSKSNLHYIKFLLYQAFIISGLYYIRSLFHTSLIHRIISNILTKIACINPVDHIAVLYRILTASVVRKPAIYVIHPSGKLSAVEFIQIINSFHIS